MNAEKPGQIGYLKIFFWSKEKGLVAYTLMDNEVFVRIN